MLQESASLTATQLHVSSAYKSLYGISFFEAAALLSGGAASASRSGWRSWTSYAGIDHGMGSQVLYEYKWVPLTTTILHQFCLCHQMWTETLTTKQPISDDTKSLRHCRQVRMVPWGMKPGGLNPVEIRAFQMKVSNDMIVKKSCTRREFGCIETSAKDNDNYIFTLD